MMRLFQVIFAGLAVVILGAAGCSPSETGNSASPKTRQHAGAIAPTAAPEPASTLAAKPIAAVASDAIAPSPALAPSAFSPASQPGQPTEISDAATADSFASLAIEQVSVGGVQLGATETAARQALGEVTRQIDENWECCGMVRTLEYGSDTTVKLLEITEGKFEVFSFSTRDPNLATPDGIRIGDSRQALLAAYGTPGGVDEENGVTTIFYGAPIDYAAALWFRLEGDRIVEIGYDAQLT